ncbi:unnamed protein product [Mytilus coruscus]|uniref:Uncharacterized protein n=1 Tax=Mytilus coruscus TaxID=42192 RepID=A0A6J8CVR9_MYTCO|nr:unnamed protein product [Mytilus coruscus]
MLEFGWPLGFDRKFEEFGNNKIAKNHSGARDFAKDIDKYIKKEVGYGAVLGPFASNPFKDHLVISPLNSVPKANSEERRVIMDLSFPKDDFDGAEISEKADISCKKLKWVLDSCGLEESVEKASSPSHRMSFLGVWFDTEKMTMEVTPDRLVEIFDLVSFWLNKDTASLKEVQSLIGKLNFIASCVRPGRIFISRILNFLREFKNEDYVLEVSLELKHDLLW